MGAERVPRGRRKAPLRTRKVFDPAKIGKISHGRRIYIAMWTHGPVRRRMAPLRSPHELFTGCVGPQNL